MAKSQSKPGSPLSFLSANHSSDSAVNHSTMRPVEFELKGLTIYDLNQLMGLLDCHPEVSKKWYYFRTSDFQVTCLERLPTICTEQNTAYYALRAFASLISSFYCTQKVSYDAYSLYGEALRQLSAAIWMRSFYDEAFLATALLLSSFDVRFLSFCMIVPALLRMAQQVHATSTRRSSNHICFP